MTKADYVLSQLAKKPDKASWFRNLPIERKRDIRLRKRYRITHADYIEISKSQNGVCAICGDPETSVMYGHKPALVVDHSRVIGKVRGLLCRQCNAKLSTIEDEQYMLLAKSYLSKTESFEFI